MNIRRTAATLTATTAALTGLVLIAPAADASGGTDVRASGTCTGAVWKLKAKPDNARLSIEFEVDSNRVGQTWSVRMTDNRNLIFTGTRRTLAPSGSFTVSILRPNRAGTDAIVARAVNTANGAICAGRVVL